MFLRLFRGLWTSQTLAPNPPKCYRNSISIAVIGHSLCPIGACEFPSERRLFTAQQGGGKPMQTHGKAPKDIYVSQHLRWYQGEIVEVDSYLKGLTPKMSLRESDRQLTFGFYQSAPG
jgi:hypothetical protein